MVVEVRESPWSGRQTSGVLLTTDHYRIYTTTNNRALLTYMPGFMEAAYAQYVDLTGLGASATGEPMPVYLMANRNQWSVLTEAITGGRDGPQTSIQAGGYCYRGTCVFWDLGGLATFSVAAHEGLHQFFDHHLEDQLPMWLEEGLCVTAEGYEIHGHRVQFTPERNVSRFQNLREAIVQGYWLPIDKLLPMHSMDAVGGYTDKAVGYYGQLWALVRFLRSRPDYRAGMERLLADAAAGKLNQAMGVSPAELKDARRRALRYNQWVSEPLFRRYISSDLQRFEREYFAYAKQLAGLE